MSVDEVGVEPAGDVEMGLIGWMWLMVLKVEVDEAVEGSRVCSKEESTLVSFRMAVSANPW